MISCPNKASSEYKYITDNIGEIYAFKIWKSYKEDFPNIDVLKKIVNKIKNFDNNFKVIKGMPFSAELIDNVKSGTQKYTVRTKIHESGIYKLNDIDTIEVIQVGKEKVNVNKLPKTFISDFKGVDTFIRQSHIKDFIEGKNEMYVYRINYINNSLKSTEALIDVNPVQGREIKEQFVSHISKNNISPKVQAFYDMLAKDATKRKEVYSKLDPGTITKIENKEISDIVLDKILKCIN